MRVLERFFCEIPQLAFVTVNFNDKSDCFVWRTFAWNSDQLG